MSKLGLHAEMSRQMVAGQAMQMGVEIMQASTMELEQIIRTALESNPMLEEEAPLAGYEDLPDESAGSTVERDDGWNEYVGQQDVLSRQQSHQYALDSLTEHQTLREYLESQVSEFELTKTQNKILSLLIDSLDQHGMFVESPRTLAQEWQMSDADLDVCLTALHRMDPAGVGAIDLQDSLLLQLKQKGLDESLASKIIKDAWSDLGNLRYQAILKHFQVDEESLELALNQIRSLNPNPGSEFEHQVRQEILPDVEVVQVHGDFDVRLCDEYQPRLRFNPEYCEMMSESADRPELRKYLKEAYQNGQGLIKAIELRKSTILAMTEALVELQRDYFKEGPLHIKPLTMEVVAERLGVHISTISRASRDKYVLSRWGIKELRSFFNSGGASQDNQEMGQEAIISLLKNIIQHEDTKKPYSDAKLSDLLQEKGIVIARRTIAKYRDMAKILPASLRKRL